MEHGELNKVVAAVAAATGLGSVTAAADCCVLPLVLAGTGVGAATFAPLVPFKASLSAVALMASRRR